MPSPNSLQFPPIIFEDASLLVIDKPAGLIVQKSHTHTEDTLDQLLADSPDLERKGIVHRLDRDTSGLMVIAKTADAQENLQAQFSERKVVKEYTALVWDEVKDSHAIIDAPIARHPHYGYKYVVMQGGRDAKTEFWKMASYKLEDQVVSLLRIKLHSGRTHQARVHLAAMAHPLVGDKVYGRRKDKTTIRQFLHASFLGFTHPATGEWQEFSSPLPTELQQFIDSLIII